MHTNAQAFERAMDYAHEHVPAPFNPHYDPRARQVADQVANEMQDEGFYDCHTRHECAVEFRQRSARYMAYLRGRHDYR